MLATGHIVSLCVWSLSPWEEVARSGSDLWREAGYGEQTWPSAHRLEMSLKINSGMISGFGPISLKKSK